MAAFASKSALRLRQFRAVIALFVAKFKAGLLPQTLLSSCLRFIFCPAKTGSLLTSCRRGKNVAFAAAAAHQSSAAKIHCQISSGFALVSSMSHSPSSPSFMHSLVPHVFGGKSTTLSHTSMAFRLQRQARNITVKAAPAFSLRWTSRKRAALYLQR
jgi:hypothetical protein